MKNSSSVALVIFIKNPQLGKAKTRIAATVGDEEALRIYRLLLKHTRQITSEIDVDRYLYYSDHVEDDEWSSDIFQKRVQCQGRLGKRMSDAFRSLSSSHDKLIIIGSDCAELNTEHLQNAINSLDHYDVVIGPVHDGGYYLLGTRGYYPELFSDIQWSTEHVTRQTIHTIERLSLSHTLLTGLSDIDYHDDWIIHGSHLEN